MTKDLPTISTFLKQQGYSDTRVRSLVFKAFADNEPLSMIELQRKLAKRMDKASIYRTLNLFEKIGVVKRLQIGWKHKFELSEVFLNHHHHATCLHCGKVYTFQEDDTIEKQLRTISKSMSFKLKEHSLELRGICLECQ